MAQYYYLLASLPELRPEQKTHAWDLGETLDFIVEQLTPADRARFWYLLYPNDNRYLLMAMARRQGLPRPSLRRARPTALLPEVLDNYERHPEALPGYMQDFLEAHVLHPPTGQHAPDTYGALEADLTERFYAAATQTGSALIDGYYARERQLRNLTAAVAARRYGLPLPPHLLPDDDWRRTLRSTSDAEPDWEKLFLGAAAWVAAAEAGDLWQLEALGEAYRWEWLDTQTLFDPFGSEAVYAYYLKLSLLHHRHRLAPEAGRERLQQLVEEKVAQTDLTP